MSEKKDSNKTQHRAWKEESSLSSPSDRDRSKKWKPAQFEPPLNKKQAEAALEELHDSSFVKRFPRVERVYADPQIPTQLYGLISFVPAKGASPNENGVYGFAKLRGNYQTVPEANQRAAHLVHKVDSYHKIYTTFVGRPFPLTLSSDYSKEVKRIDLKKELKNDISHDVKSKMEKERKDIEDIKKREDEILERNQKILNDPDNKEDMSDPKLIEDEYITLRVKKAQLSWTALETRKKLQEIYEILAKTRRDLEEMEAKNPEHKKTYFKKYMDARKKAGLDKATHQENFMKFMVEDAEIPEADAEYEKLMNKEKDSNHLVIKIETVKEEEEEEEDLDEKEE